MSVRTRWFLNELLKLADIDIPIGFLYCSCVSSTRTSTSCLLVSGVLLFKSSFSSESLTSNFKLSEKFGSDMAQEAGGNLNAGWEGWL